MIPSGTNSPPADVSNPVIVIKTWVSNLKRTRRNNQLSAFDCHAFVLSVIFVKVCDFATLIESMNVFICLFISCFAIEKKDRDGGVMVSVLASRRYSVDSNPVRVEPTTTKCVFLLPH